MIPSRVKVDQISFWVQEGTNVPIYYPGVNVVSIAKNSSGYKIYVRVPFILSDFYVSSSLIICNFPDDAMIYLNYRECGRPDEFAKEDCLFKFSNCKIKHWWTYEKNGALEYEALISGNFESKVFYYSKIRG